MKSAKEYWKEKFDEYPQTDADKLSVAMMQEYAQKVVENLNIPDVIKSVCENDWHNSDIVNCGKCLICNSKIYINKTSKLF